MTTVFCYWCSKHGTTTDANIFCADCNKSLCVSCLESHNLDPMNITHRLSELGSVRGCTFAGTQPCKNDLEEKTVPEIKNFKLICKFNLKIKSPIYISSLAVNAENKLLICNTRGKSLFVYNEKGKQEDECTLAGEPWDIALLPGAKKAIVTLDSIQGIQFLECLPKVKAVKFLKLPWKCYGITIAQNHICLGGMGKIHILNNSGQHISDIDVRHRGYVWYLHQVSNENICYSLYDFNEVACVKLNGNVCFKYENKSLAGPEAMATDKYGNYYIACRDSSIINRLSTTGQHKGVILDGKDEIKRPYGIAFNGDCTRLVVSNNDGETIYIFACLFS